MELLNIIISVLGIVLGTFVAYHVYSLSQQQTFRDRFNRRMFVQKQVDDLLSNIRGGGNSKVELINIKKYDTHYPSINSKNRHGYTYMAAELKGYHFAGVEFFFEVLDGYKINSDEFSRKQKNKNQEHVTLFKVGVIPYEWIESIDLRGDDTSYRPQFYVHFKGKKKYPYKGLRYFKRTSDKPFNYIKVNMIE